MEQPNMMANGIPPQNMVMNTMQRPQGGNLVQQIYATVMNDLRQKMGTLPAGWQSTFDIAQRTTQIVQLVTGLRMLRQETHKCINIAENFEERTIHQSSNREVYMESMSQKLQEITLKRQHAAQAMNQNGQLSMAMNNNSNNMDNMNNMQNGGMAQINMNMGMGMNMGLTNGGMGMSNEQMGFNAGQQSQNFPAQLQRQMQPSPLPPQQQAQQPQNDTLDPSALQQNTQMPPSMPNPNHKPPQPPAPPKMNQMGQPQANVDPTIAEILATAKRMFASMPEEQRKALRNQYLSSLPPQQRQTMQEPGGDPLFKYMMTKARELLKQRAGQGAPQNPGGMQMSNSMGMSANQQTSAPQAGAPNFDFSSIMGQQANAIKLQESGEQVVPASNNNSLALGGQVNMSQGVNPQMLGNQNNQSGTNPQLQRQLQAMHAENQRRDHVQRQQQLAQQQAFAQQQQAQNQLRGQPGGLNAPNALNGGQVNSPAMNMNMLNRPMAPPGQNPSTPQQNRPQGMPPQTPVNPANQLAQHHQTMVNQNNAQANQAIQIPPQSRERLLASIPMQARAKLSTMPPQQVNTILQQMALRQANVAGAANPQDNTQGMQPSIGGTQKGNQMMAGLPTNMSTAVPGFNAQPPPSQQPQQQIPNDPAAMQQRLMQNHQNAVLKGRAMDMRPYPKPVLQNLGIQVPEAVDEWGKLKAHIMQNQTVLPGNLLEKLQGLQNQWYGSHPEELQMGMRTLQQRMQQQAGQQGAQPTQGQQQQQQQQGQSARPPSTATMPNGQAPPAQMVPPTAPMQQPPNQSQNMGGLDVNQGQPKMPMMLPQSAEDMQLFRQKVPGAQNMTDEQIKAAIMRRKFQQAQQAAPGSMQMDQSVRAQMQMQAIANGTQSSNPQQAAPQQPLQAPRPPPSQQATNAQTNNKAQGQKRPQAANDDVMEIPNPNTQPSAPQVPPMQPNQTQQPRQTQMPLTMPTQAQLEKMNPQQRMLITQKIKQMESLRKAQMGITTAQGAGTSQQQPQSQSGVPPHQQGPQQQPSQGPDKQQMARIQTLWQEVQRTTLKGPPIQLDSQGLQQVQTSLTRLFRPMANIDKTFVAALCAPNFGEQRLKEAMRVKVIVQQNARDEHGNPKEYLSVGPADMKKLEGFVGHYFQDLKALREHQDAAKAKALAAANAAQTQAQTQQAQTQPAKPQQSQAAPPLNRKQSQQAHARKASAAASKAPPAPTDNKHFDWGPSPQGVPKYEPGRNELTPDKLKFPPAKKRRTGTQSESQESTPAGQTATPGASSTSPVTSTKVPSPEQLRKMQAAQAQAQALAKAAEPDKSKFKCDDSLCDASIKGFETEELLKQHKESAHKPIADPLKFLTDQLDISVKALDEDKAAAAAAKSAKAAVQPRGKPAPVARAGVKKELQTPQLKQESSTPASKTGAKATPAAAGNKPGDNKVQGPVVEAPAQEKTLMETMAGKIGFELPKEAAQTALPDSTLEPADEAWLDMLASNAEAPGGGKFVESWHDFAGVTDWGLPETDSSPELTPSDGTQESHESDISATERMRVNFEWDAFGNGDTMVPNALMQTLGIGASTPDLAKDEDAAMADGQEPKDEEAAKKKRDNKEEDPWNWSSDLMTWEGMFGPDAGLNVNGMDWGMAGSTY